MSSQPHAPACPLCERSQQILAGRFPGHVKTLDHTHVVLSENQGCPGWCVLILKNHADHLADLPSAAQTAIFSEVSRVAAAIRAVYGPLRINYECLGNQVAHVHWHVIPRHASDPDPRNPVWGWPADRLRGSLTTDQRDDLARRLAAAL